MSLKLQVQARRGDFLLDAGVATDARRVCLFGRSGAGKTSLANAVAGLLRPESGRIEIDGETLLDTAGGIAVPAWRRRIGCVFQEARLFPHMSVRGNLNYARTFGGAKASAPDLASVAALLGIEALLDRPPSNLSGGEARRVAIGRALLAAPRLLILDEPLTGLDGARRAELLAHIDALGRGDGPPLLYVSHSIEETARLADVVVLMQGGRTLACAPPAEAFDHPEAEEAAGLTAPISILEGRVLAHEAGATRLSLGDGGAEFLTPRLDLEPGQPARVIVDARDVAVALSDPTDSSVQNRLPATIATVTPHAGGGLVLRLQARGARLKSLVTPAAAERLALRPGLQVHALIKATAAARHG
jgi:molybdate transport system ATP-binding protein